ncbi:MAG: UDP-N-acetylglucosamine 2-epimerase (non-hydrolyzing) [Cycloclasticus sp.]|nr:UDP-N-acetylglucosamine 2-epimerase (non-hydrolyzing) [Cycloclasticus sp.]MBG97199.1 UDP-N-acetylglucosamine 2-epimerase (non-hydrolyzing) [Cycloclasticus sp.]|tara:strand:- start:3634 stop:4722 length:1089 start_codon:yes stop_codon:yes gene_type:complete
MDKQIDIIVGARPNFMKVAALFAVSKQFPLLKLRLIHTGQHYDELMSGVFFSELGIPSPDCNLGVGSGSHAYQTAKIMIGYEQWLIKNPADVCVVVGDVNSTLACSLVATKMGIRVAHIEAGLRSFDKEMPEEINRVLTDSLSDFLFVTEPSGLNNLLNEGKKESDIYLVGNLMIDTLKRNLSGASKKAKYKDYHLEPKKFALVTLHRPSNVDNDLVLGEIVREIIWVSTQFPVFFTMHPRTLNRLTTTGLIEDLERVPTIYLSPPLSYLDAISAMSEAKVVITDSGGLQEETSALGVPCLTLRDNTERPITLYEGTNTLIAGDWDLFREKVDGLGEIHEAPENPIWDGRAGERILQILETA